MYNIPFYYRLCQRFFLPLNNFLQIFINFKKLSPILKNFYFYNVIGNSSICNISLNNDMNTISAQENGAEINAGIEQTGVKKKVNVNVKTR